LVFGATALTLAAIGIFAAQRTGERATQLALGASGRQVFWLIPGDGQKPPLQ
jgi:hypothetical protein